MITDSLNSIIIAFRRFLLIGHIESVLKFNQLFNLKNLINDYNLKNSIFKNLNNNNNKEDNEINFENFNLSNKNLIELKNYLKLIEILQLINNYEQDKKNYSNIELIYKQTNKLLTRFLVFNDSEEIEKEGEDELIFKELRKLYIPLLFNKIFDILIENDIINGTNKNINKNIELINLLSDETFKFYNIFKQQNELKKFMKKLSLINCERNNKTLII
ncbi:hypothetical protein B5S32_g5676 [[Candida] boidinii]|nr:hypothetical protein B5S32_g5676 [[Candida] boidinii]